ncbi:hypothetical protein FJZ53_03995 [Candidatus Woesearchaeota archaeon]|nr:hypothetical protein [Candidatus Woesearchaeota archaeon]
MEKIDQEFVELMKHLVKIQGADDLTALITAKVFLEPSEVAMDDIAKDTGYSLASISNKTKLFEQAGIFKRVTKPGTKKVFFYMEKDVSKMIMNMFLTKVQVITIAKNKLPDIIKKYKAQSKTEKDKQKLKIIEHYYNDILKFDTIIQEFILKLAKLEENG